MSYTQRYGYASLRSSYTQRYGDRGIPINPVPTSTVYQDKNGVITDRINEVWNTDDERVCLFEMTPTELRTSRDPYIASFIKDPKFWHDRSQYQRLNQRALELWRGSNPCR